MHVYIYICIHICIYIYIYIYIHIHKERERERGRAGLSNIPALRPEQRHEPGRETTKHMMRYDTVRYDSIQHGMNIRSDMTWCDVARCGLLQPYHIIACPVIYYSGMLCNADHAMQCILCNAMQCNGISEGLTQSDS